MVTRHATRPVRQVAAPSVGLRRPAGTSGRAHSYHRPPRGQRHSEDRSLVISHEDLHIPISAVLFSSAPLLLDESPALFHHLLTGGRACASTVQRRQRQRQSVSQRWRTAAASGVSQRCRLRRLQRRWTGVDWPGMRARAQTVILLQCRVPCLLLTAHCSVLTAQQPGSPAGIRSTPRRPSCRASEAYLP